MARFHFVEDYENLVERLVREHPLDEAMAKAVRGPYQLFGDIETVILLEQGLRPSMRLVDLGCGSGRLASSLHREMDVSYVGIDVVEALLEYARMKAPRFEFKLHRELSLPEPDASADMVSAFSVFTHLLHAESFIYMQEAFRVLRGGGKLVFSFLEFAEPAHWDIFLATRDATLATNLPHLNMFLERSVIDVWAGRLGFAPPRYFDATSSWSGHQLGQSVAVLAKA